MATYAAAHRISRPRFPGTGRLSSALSSVITPHKAVLVNLMSIPLMLMGIGCIDAAAFIGDLMAGLIVTGISLMWIEHMIADDSGSV